MLLNVTRCPRLLVAGLIVISCGGDEQGGSPDPADLLSVTAGVRIGSVDAPDYALQEIFDVAQFGDALFVAQWRVPEVRVYHAETGRFLRSIGRAGEGPGEFGQPSKLGFLGDTLWVMDSRGANIQLYDSANAFVGAVRFPPGPPFDGFGPLWPRAMIDHGHVWAEPSVGTNELGGDQLVEVPVFSVDRAGEIVAQLGTRRFENAYFQLNMEQRGFIMVPNPFAPGDLVEWVPSLHAAVEVRLDSVPDHAAVRLINGGGDTIAHYDLLLEPAPVTPGARQAIEDEIFERYRIAEQGMTREAFARAFERSLRIPTHQPLVRRVLPSSAGEIWLERPLATPDSVEWLILSRTLHPRARVRLPAGTRAVMAGRDRIWTVEKDSNDVSFLQEYRLGH